MFLKSGVFATYFVMLLLTLSSNTPMSRHISFFRELAPLGLIYGPRHGLRPLTHPFRASR